MQRVGGYEHWPYVLPLQLISSIVQPLPLSMLQVLSEAASLHVLERRTVLVQATVAGLGLASAAKAATHDAWKTINPGARAKGLVSRKSTQDPPHGPVKQLSKGCVYDFSLNDLLRLWR